MAVDALDFNSCPNLTVEFGITVAILIEVAVDAVHSLFHVDVHHVDWNTVALFAMDLFKLIGWFDGCHEVLCGWLLDLDPLMVE